MRDLRDWYSYLERSVRDARPPSDPRNLAPPPTASGGRSLTRTPQARAPAAPAPAGPTRPRRPRKIAMPVELQQHLPIELGPSRPAWRHVGWIGLAHRDVQRVLPAAHQRRRAFIDGICVVAACGGASRAHRCSTGAGLPRCRSRRAARSIGAYAPARLPSRARLYARGVAYLDGQSAGRRPRAWAVHHGQRGGPPRPPPGTPARIYAPHAV